MPHGSLGQCSECTSTRRTSLKAPHPHLSPELSTEDTCYSVCKSRTTFMLSGSNDKFREKQKQHIQLYSTTLNVTQCHTEGHESARILSSVSLAESYYVPCKGRHSPTSPCEALTRTTTTGSHLHVYTPTRLPIKAQA